MPSLRLLIILGLSLLAAEFAAETWLMLQHVDLAAMQASAPDEMLFIEKAPLQSGWSFLAGYGPPFWLLVKAIFGHLSFDVAVPLARGLFIAMKYASWLILFGILFKRDARAAVLFLFVMLVTPGYFFFGKIISPEYMLLLLSALSLWCLQQDKSSYGAGYAGALFFACLATATKDLRRRSWP
jgi:4-amino-4-deoxy-L-arabinose transferase-like glycosyltransferase